MKRHPRLLVLRGGAIGDFVMTLPALRAIRDRWPQAHIELVGYSHIARLAEAGGLIDQVRSLDEAGIARFFSLNPEFDDRQRGYIRSFELIFSYLHDPTGTVKQNLLDAGARQVIYGSPIVTEVHAVDHLLKPLEEVAICPDDRIPYLDMDQESRASGYAWLEEHQLSGDAMAIHPGSGSLKKNWPADRFVALAATLRARGREVFFVLGEADAQAQRVIEAQVPDVPVLVGRTLVELACVLSACKSFVGNDSGITHLASALGLEVVALFGPSDADMWGAPGENVHIIRAPNGDLTALDVQTVTQVV